MEIEGTRAALLDTMPVPGLGVDEMPWSLRTPQPQRVRGDAGVKDDETGTTDAHGTRGTQDERISTQFVLDGLDPLSIPASKDVYPMTHDDQSRVLEPADEPPAKRKRGRPAKPAGTAAPRRTVKRVENRPESEQRHLADVARYLWRLRADMGLTNEEIAAEAAREVPGITQFTVSKLVSPTYITQVGSPLYLTIRAVLHALKSSFTDMEKAIGELPPGLSEESRRLSEIEHSLLFLVRRMSPTHAEILLQTARMFASADSGGTTGTSIEAAERAKSGMTWNEFWDSEQDGEQGGNNASGSHSNRNTDRKIQ